MEQPFLKEPIIAALKKAGRPLKPKELAKLLDLEGGEYRAFRGFLRSLQEAGELYRVKGGRYAPPENINLVVGHLSKIRSGAAYLIPEKPGEEDIYVPADEMETALHGDKVVVRKERTRRPEGRVVRVLERARSEFVGTADRGEHFLTVTPDDPKFRKTIFIPVAEAGETKAGEKVLVEITDWGSPHSTPVGRVKELLGMPGDPGLDVLMIIKHNGLPTEFPQEVEEAAESIPATIPPEEIASRLDLRDTVVVTIDPVTAKDFDDALSVTELDDGNYELGVHIADVSHYVRYNNPIDVEAWSRGTSVYLVDRVLPMLPEKLSNHLCSLNPNVDRLAMSVIAKLTPRGKILDYRIEDTVIRSTRRLSYEQAQGYFDGDKDLRAELTDVSATLDILNNLAQVLHAKRVRRGALDFDLPESRVELDADGLPVDIRKVVRLASHRLVEGFMLLANELVAHHLKIKQVPALYRVHEEPAEKKLEDLQAHLGRFGYLLKASDKGKVPPKELQRVLSAAEGKPEEQILNTLVLRSLARARYDVFPLGHYGLALKDYGHFTSPIRRYPDLVVHRTLRMLSGKQPWAIKDKARYREWVIDTGVHSSERERLAEGAERDSVELKKIQFMERHVGDVFSGVVTGVEAFGFFVELDRYHVSGLVHLSNLDDDYYEYREEEFSLVGSNTGRRFTLGEQVSVQVLAVNRQLRQIDFILEGAGMGPSDEEERPSRRRREAKKSFEGSGKTRRPRARRDTSGGRGSSGKPGTKKATPSSTTGKKKSGSTKKRTGGRRRRSR